MSNLVAAFATFLPRLPFFFICVTGIVLALMNWNQHRKPAIFVLSGSAALLLGFVLAFSVHLVAINHTGSGRSAAEIGTLITVLGIFQSLLSALGYGLLLVAAFIGRNRPPLPPTI